MKFYSVLIAKVMVALACFAILSGVLGLSSVTGLLVGHLALAHPSNQPSIHDTMAGVIDRLKLKLPMESLQGISPELAVEFLTDQERKILGTSYWMFDVNVPVTVSVMRDRDQAEPHFWLTDQNWLKTEQLVQADGTSYEVWQKNFSAGHVGLGTNGFRRHWRHYFVTVQAQDSGAVQAQNIVAVQAQDTKGKVSIRNMYPGMHRIARMTEGTPVFVYDSEYQLEKIPALLQGAVLVQAVENRVYETLLVDLFRSTPFPATPSPDQIVLTWSDAPATTQSIQWRTDTSVASTALRYREANHGDTIVNVPAETLPLIDSGLVNDSECHRHTVTLSNLTPATTYEYALAVGAGWTKWIPFTTAPGQARPFKFIYMGDAQNGLDTWGRLIQKAHANEPDTAFYIMAGDLINRGIQRDDWDLFWHNAQGVFDRRQLVPAIGNHEDQGANGPWMYLDMFALPKNGSDAIAKERSYSFTYSNALFVVLDTNADIKAQTPWLEEQLANSAATWKFVVYHHPAYSSGPRRDNPLVRKWWSPLFDKYHVDMALQGHDHAYLRTYPIKDNQRVESPEEGTVYVVSVSGTKFYDQADPWYEEFGMTKVSTYQVLDLTIEGATMTYKAYDIDGKIRDQLVIKKK
jgi:3',5'-cyclic AMP phosphodiesterase CpdA